MQRQREDAATQRRKGGLITTFLAASVRHDGWPPGLLSGPVARHAAPPTAAYDDSISISPCIASIEWTERPRSIERAEEHRRWYKDAASQQSMAAVGGRTMVALPSLFEMKNRSLPRDRQGVYLVPVCPLADAARHCLCAFLGWSWYGLCSEQEQIDAHRGRGREWVEHLQGSRSACFDVDRFSAGHRLSCGLAKRLDDITALCSGGVHFSKEQATTSERDAMRAGHAGLARAKVDGEIENWTVRA
jgi:hypothetical protein